MTTFDKYQKETIIKLCDDIGIKYGDDCLSDAIVSTTIVLKLIEKAKYIGITKARLHHRTMEFIYRDHLGRIIKQLIAVGSVRKGVGCSKGTSYFPTFFHSGHPGSLTAV